MNYSEECNQLNTLTKKARNQFYELQSFFTSQTLSFDANIESINSIKVIFLYYFFCKF